MAKPERKLVRPDTHYVAAAVTPHNTNDIIETYSLYIGGAGALKVDMSDGSTQTFTAVAAGSVVPIAVTRVYSTGTTATGIIALY
jgi:hypothetical protein